MTDPSAQRIPYAVETRDLRLVFARHADRWGHRIEFLSPADEPVPMLASAEGDSSGARPAGPAIQDLQLHTGADGDRQVLGVGAAGGCHWSLACGARRLGESASASAIVLEIAGRVPAGGPSLASVYLLEPPARLVAADAFSATLAVGNHHIVVSSPTAAVRVERGRLAFLPDDSGPGMAKRTVQWQVRFQSA